MAQHLSQRLGQQVIVENRPGGGGNTATEQVINAAPDGYTVLVVATANAINTSFLPASRSTSCATSCRSPGSGASPTSWRCIRRCRPGRSPKFIAHAKANPRQINFASGGTGGSNHLTGELFKAVAGIDIVHVPYRGNAAAYADLISGRVQLIFADVASSREHVRSGALRGIAVA